MTIRATPRPPAARRILPPHNLYGDHGPRCHACSGLGSVLIPGQFGAVTRSATRCTCKGTGIDQEAVARQQISALVNRLEALERRDLQRAKRMQELQTILRGSKLKMSRQYWQELIHWAVADGTAIHTTTTEAIIFPNVTIPGNYMADGRALRVQAYGKLSTTGTPTMTWAIRYNGVAGTLLATTEAITMGSGVTNVLWSLSADIQTRSNGSAGSLIVTGELKVHTSSTAVSVNVFGVSGFDAPAAVGSLDLTADWPLSVTADWSANSASNTLTGHQYYLESLN